MEELEARIAELEARLNLEEAEDLVAEFDVDGDGTLNEEELSAYLVAYPSSNGGT